MGITREEPQGASQSSNSYLQALLFHPHRVYYRIIKVCQLKPAVLQSVHHNRKPQAPPVWIAAERDQARRRGSVARFG